MATADMHEGAGSTRPDRRTPTVVWVLIASGIVALVAAGVLQGQLTVGGQPPSSTRMAFIVVVGGLGNPLLIAGLVGLVLSRMDVLRRH